MFELIKLCLEKIYKLKRLLKVLDLKEFITRFKDVL